MFTAELTDYELFECQFGYVHNGQFEDIRVLRPGEHQIPDSLFGWDYWIVNDASVLRMHYDPQGRFLGAEVEQPGRLAGYLQEREAVWTAAEPFAAWWARHPELHTRRAA